MRYDWWRAHHGLPYHANWHHVAQATGLGVPVVVYVALCLLDRASQATPRGSIGDFKPHHCAGVSVADVDRVVAALRDIHWIEGHMLSQWDERQPQREDAHAASRQQAHRHAMSRDVTHGHAGQDENVTHGHAMSRNESVTLHQNANVTNVSAPDRDKDITTTSSVAAREEPKSARSLATALPAGALARGPQTTDPNIGREEAAERAYRNGPTRPPSK
jgi:hypothetical protein